MEIRLQVSTNVNRNTRNLEGFVFNTQILSLITNSNITDIINTSDMKSFELTTNISLIVASSRLDYSQ